jgi:hypothetical protein
MSKPIPLLKSIRNPETGAVAIAASSAQGADVYCQIVLHLSTWTGQVLDCMSGNGRLGNPIS